MIPQLNQIYDGHALNILKKWDDNFIDMCITSPPYWKLRSYHSDPPIWDADPSCKHDWITTMTPGLSGGKKSEKVQIKGQANFQEVPPSEIATCSQCGAWRGELGQEPDFDLFVYHLCDIFDEVKRVLKPKGSLWVNLGDSYFGSKSKINKLPSKSLVGIPFRFVVEMLNRGWILRNVVLWKKDNSMPTSAKDRFTDDFEYFFFFVQQDQYYFKQQFEPLAESTLERMKYHWSSKDVKASKYQEKNGLNRDISFKDAINPKGRNMRTVWEINTKNYKGSHFAVYPEELIQTPIDACCPPKGIVFDPFMGSGTTGLVALKQAKSFLGTEINPDYIQLAYDRLDPLLNNKKIDEWLL